VSSKNNWHPPFYVYQDQRRRWLKAAGLAALICGTASSGFIVGMLATPPATPTVTAKSSDAPAQKRVAANQAAPAAVSEPQATETTGAAAKEREDCERQTWPYIDRTCAERLREAQKTRQVRVIGNDQSAPPTVETATPTETTRPLGTGVTPPAPAAEPASVPAVRQQSASSAPQQTTPPQSTTGATSRSATVAPAPPNQPNSTPAVSASASTTSSQASSATSSSSPQTTSATSKSTAAATPNQTGPAPSASASLPLTNSQTLAAPSSQTVSQAPSAQTNSSTNRADVAQETTASQTAQPETTPSASVKPSKTATEAMARNKNAEHKRKTARKEQQPRAVAGEAANATVQAIVVRDSSGNRRTILVRPQEGPDGRRVTIVEGGRQGKAVETTGQGTDRVIQERRGGVVFADEPPGVVQPRERPGGFLSDLFNFGRSWNGNQ